MRIKDTELVTLYIRIKCNEFTISVLIFPMVLILAMRNFTCKLVKNPWTGLKYVHVNVMLNLQHFAIHNVSSAILYGAIGIDLLVVRQNSYGFERSGPRQCDVQLAMCEDWLRQEQPH